MPSDSPAVPEPLERSLRNRFSGLPLDRCDEWRVDAARVRATWNEARVIVVDFEGRALGGREQLRFLNARDLDPALHEAASLLGLHDGHAWFALPAEAWPGASAHPDSDWIGLREAALLWDRFESGLFAYAKALLLWQSRARHCGACGAPTRRERAGHCLRCSREGCGLAHFPRTDAAVIVIVTDGTRCLLGRQPGWPPGRYSTLAGFVEPGESLEDAVRREVREEAGVQVGVCEYQSSQPWPFPGALMVGFRATALDPALQCGDELEDVRWIEAAALADAVRRGDLRLPPRISVSRRLIEDWLIEQLGAEAVAQQDGD